MKRFTLFLTIAVVIGAATGLHGQHLTVNIAGSSTGGSVTTTIGTQPTNQSVALGGTLTLSVAATGANLTYQWQKGGVDIFNATNATYIKAAATASDAGTYTVVVRGDCGGSVTSMAVAVTFTGVKIALKVFLQGPYVTGSTTPANNDKMADGLRSANLIPIIEPYTGLGFTHQGGGGNEQTTNDVLTVTGDNAVVDWVFIELRSKTAPATVLYTRSALIQRDGDVVDVDGTSALTFATAPTDNYYIAVKHRNHLGFRPLSNVPLGATTTTFDFTDNSVIMYGSRPALRQIATGVYGMYAGDANHNGLINAVDKNGFWRPQNGLFNYLSADFNLNGFVNAIDKNAFWLVNNSIFQQLD